MAVALAVWAMLASVAAAQFEGESAEDGRGLDAMPRVSPVDKPEPEPAPASKSTLAMSGGLPDYNPGQPQGALSGKTVFLSPGHGWYYSDTLGRWATQRGNNFGLIEDHSNGEAVLQHLVRYLHNAGANVWPHPYNIGNGAAVKSGLRAARGDYIILMDADGQHKPEDIARLLEHADQFDMVVGARTKASKTKAHRNLANSIYNQFASH